MAVELAPELEQPEAVHLMPVHLLNLHLDLARGATVLLLQPYVDASPAVVVLAIETLHWVEHYVQTDPTVELVDILLAGEGVLGDL